MNEAAKNRHCFYAANIQANVVVALGDAPPIRAKGVRSTNVLNKQGEGGITLVF
ncbi:MAG: hypothetical protein HPKKFMNG_01949 [Planctomycetes bacterium]|nr:hypothetical protein [Planctomycetota bacterium]